MCVCVCGVGGGVLIVDIDLLGRGMVLVVVFFFGGGGGGGDLASFPGLFSRFPLYKCSNFGGRKERSPVKRLVKLIM